MADEHVEAAAAPEATNGAAEKPKLLTRAEQDARDREAFLSGAWNDDDEAEAPAPKKDGKKKAAVESDEDDEVDAGDRDDDDEDLDDADDADDADEVVDEDDLDADDEDEDLEGDDEDKEPEGADDPELAKRLAKVQKYEKKVRDQATAREKQFAQERDAFVAEWKPKLEEYEAFEKLKGRKTGAIEKQLKALGYTEDDFEDVSKILWGLSKTGAADPKNREAVARMQANRELREKNDALEARLAKLEGDLTSQKTEAQQNQVVEKYLGRVTKAVGDDTPLVKKRLELEPKSTKRALERVAYRLSKKAGEFADPKKVTRKYETILARDRELAAKLAEAPTETTTDKGKKKPAIAVVDKTKKGATTETAPKKQNGSNGSLIPSREEMIDRLRKIDRGELDPEHD